MQMNGQPFDRELASKIIDKLDRDDYGKISLNELAGTYLLTEL
jgi:hypothetical protein